MTRQNNMMYQDDPESCAGTLMMPLNEKFRYDVRGLRDRKKLTVV